MTNAAASISAEYSLENTNKPKYQKELGQDEFLKLMMAQLKHQDPMEPMDNGEFLGQMAQFSTVTGIEGMQESIDRLSQTYATSQTLQSTQLVGKEVLIESSNIILDSSGEATGEFDLDTTSGNVEMIITSQSGVLVRSQSLGELPSGQHAFTWNGKDSEQNSVPEGIYNITITTTDGEETTAATVLTGRTVDSIEFSSSNETILNTKQGDTFTLADVRRIRQSTTN